MCVYVCVYMCVYERVYGVCVHNLEKNYDILL